MLSVDIRYEDGREQVLEVSVPAVIGKDAECEIRLAHWRVGRTQARVSKLGDFLQIEDLGSLLGMRINGIRCAQHFPLLATDDVTIGPCRLRFRWVQPVAVDRCTVPDDSRTFDEPSESGVVIDSEIRSVLHAELIALLDVRKLDLNNLPTEILKTKAQEALRDMLACDDRGLTVAQQELIIEAVVSDVVGLGVLQPLIDDPSVSEIMVNRHDQIYVEREGALRRHSVNFVNDAAVRTVIERIVYPIGRRIDDASPMVDARLSDGSRVNAVIAPIALHGACLTIRKFPTKRLQLSDLVNLGSMTRELAQFLTLAVHHRLNILISGGTGSGKTTLLNVLGSQIPSNQRVITIEDAAELQIGHPHVVSLESRPRNVEGSGEITIRDLVRNALRMRPDRIVVGECRGAEAIDMLAAMNTGHDGSLTTLHANSPRDALSRLETMVLMAGKELPLLAIRDQIARAIQLIVQQSRLPDGKRMITAIDELTGLESGQIQLQPLVRLDHHQRCCLPQGLPPTFLRQWRESEDSAQIQDIEKWFAHSGADV
ncbi:MAG: Flp pilus assembly complex ATPase component TadA [Burkholderiaceae bacterium]|nr:Flp pilus assembly complex ATPase component TadA [Burkholderiaceae bacterium]MCD8516361.1 Flp pilus assembly complex ATPase component TadA [Burkholderiaceae bacterium]MCD8538239.1 Flp pilus assembly complex ATPase component TadA [Burkholderiaceae bacterium]MCD8565778.1 Flp pilus assembly complex ATPase component TadA [Burkholderiaceae bacterium]